MTISENINEGIKEAMRSQNRIRLDTLRMLKSKILTVDARGNVPDSEILKLFKTYYGNLVEARDQAQAANRPEMVEKLKCELEIVQEFLPKALSVDETKKIIEQAIIDSGAKNKKDFGLVMKSAMKLNSAVDGKLAKELAGQLLPD
ncbi:MAG: GatB/YqeY domain-containing protein [Parachlamydiaceae bacterium]